MKTKKVINPHVIKRAIASLNRSLDLFQQTDNYAGSTKIERTESGPFRYEYDNSLKELEHTKFLLENATIEIESK